MKELWVAAKAWSSENRSSNAAGIAFYTILSLAPFLVLALGIADLLMGSEVARSQLLQRLDTLIGTDAARLVASIIDAAGRSHAAGFAAVAALLGTLVAATAAIAEVQSALDQIFGGDCASQPWRVLLRTRVIAVLIALGSGLLLVASVLLTSVMTYFLARFVQEGTGRASTIVAINELVAAGFVFATFAALLRLLPTQAPAWHAAWRGAAAAAILFMGGKLAIAWYIGSSAAIKPYGAASSVVVLMMWIYYIAAIFLFGALVARACEGPRPHTGERPAR
jgi:membrane protein